MNCPTCGAEIPDNSTFCESCGNAVTAQPASPIDGTYQQQPIEQAAPSANYAQQQADPSAQPAQTAAPAAPYAQAAAAPVKDSGSIGWGILGFLFPIVGLILFLVWRTKKPKCAKVAGIGAIIGFVLGIIANIAMM
jgi:hypothetical protein